MNEHKFSAFLDALRHGFVTDREVQWRLAAIIRRTAGNAGWRADSFDQRNGTSRKVRPRRPYDPCFNCSIVKRIAMPATAPAAIAIKPQRGTLFAGPMRATSAYRTSVELCHPS